MEKNIESMQEKCKNCGGNLVFSPNSQDLFCENCTSHYPIDIEGEIQNHNFEEAVLGTKEYQKYIEENKAFKCPNCGANVVLNKFDISKVCPYCSTSLVVDSDKNTGLKPDSIIPFRFDENEAGKRFANAIKKKFFAPNKFKKQLPENKIKGIYIPSFAFCADTNSVYQGQFYNQHEVTDSDGNSRTEYEYFMVSGNYSQFYDDVLVECSSHINQKEFDGFLPFRMNEKKPYQNAFILGYSVEKYDKQVKDCTSIYKSKIDRMIRQDILRQYSYDGVSYLNISTNITNEKYRYDILPVYRFDYDYNNKKYVTYMNGQTGRVDNNIPKSKIKIALVTILAILVVLIPIIIAIISSMGE